MDDSVMLNLYGHYALSFIRQEVSCVVRAYQEWMLSVGEKGLVATRLNPDMDEAIRELEPLETPFTKCLLCATTNGWTSLIYNCRMKYGCSEHTEMLGRIMGCRAVYVLCEEPSGSETGDPEEFRWGGYMLEVTRPQASGAVETRTLSLINDGGKWIFYAKGALLPFEREAQYSNRRVRERFGEQLLLNYVRALGLEPFHSDFYAPSSGLTLLVGFGRSG